MIAHRFRAAGPSVLQLSDTASSEFGFITREELRQALSQRGLGWLHGLVDDRQQLGGEVVDPSARSGHCQDILSADILGS